MPMTTEVCGIDFGVVLRDDVHRDTRVQVPVSNIDAKNYLTNTIDWKVMHAWRRADANLEARRA